MQTIALEFRHSTGNIAVLGTDTLMGLDGRWGSFRRTHEIYKKVEKLRQLRSKYNDLHFVGFTYMGRNFDRIVAMADRNPPAWVR